MAATSQLARNLRTVLDQMADAARGKRIRALRQARPDLTEPLIVEAINALGGPGTITVRGYQYWESTGGIRYEKVVLLATVHDVDPDWVYYGPEGKPATPQLMESLNGAPMDLATRLDQIDHKLDLLLGATQAPETGPTPDLPGEPPPLEGPPPNEQDEGEDQTGEEEQ